MGLRNHAPMSLGGGWGTRRMCEREITVMAVSLYDLSYHLPMGFAELDDDQLALQLPLSLRNHEISHRILIVVRQRHPLWS